VILTPALVDQMPDIGQSRDIEAADDALASLMS
jgi:hypothetical protein